ERKPEGDDLDRQLPARAEHVDELLVADEHDAAAGRGGDDLLADECATPALDEVQARIDLVGAVERGRDLVDVGEARERDAELARERGGRLRGGHAGHPEARADALAERAHELDRRAPGPEADDVAVVHVLERAGRDPCESAFHVVPAGEFLPAAAAAAQARPACASAAWTIASRVKPKRVRRSLSGADAPKVCMPMRAPSVPVQRSHPKVDACSTETRARTAGGRTDSRYSRLCRSNSSHDGRLTTRGLRPRCTSSS